MPGRCKLRIAPPASSGNWRAIQAKPPLAVSFSSISSLFKSIEGIRASVRAVASGSTIACGSAYTETAATLSARTRPLRSRIDPRTGSNDSVRSCWRCARATYSSW